MSYRLKVTLPDPTLDGLRAMARQQGEPVARLAARIISDGLAVANKAEKSRSLDGATSTSQPSDSDRRAAWLEPYFEGHEWRSNMWGAIVALCGRYPRAFAHLRDGWWRDTSHVETLSALVVWRDWIDQAADDPRHELAFQAQLADYSNVLRQEGGSVSSIWRPSAPPDEWAC